jgi:hypothetical protein
MTNQTTRNRSFLQRIAWYLYPEYTGRPFRIEEVNSPRMKTAISKMEKTFLPELDRMTGNVKNKTKKGTQNESNRQFTKADD